MKNMKINGKSKLKAAEERKGKKIKNLNSNLRTHLFDF